MSKTIIWTLSETGSGNVEVSVSDSGDLRFQQGDDLVQISSTSAKELLQFLPEIIEHAETEVDDA